VGMISRIRSRHTICSTGANPRRLVCREPLIVPVRNNRALSLPPPSLPPWTAFPWIVSPLTDSHQCPLLPSLPSGLQTNQIPSRYLSRVLSASVLQRSVYAYYRPLLTPFIDVLYPSNRPVMLAIRANGDATAQVSSSSSSSSSHSCPDIISQAPCSNW